MQVNASTCIKRVGGNAICSHCNGNLIKHGICNSGKPRYKCKNCKKTQVENYTYNAYHQSIKQQIRVFTKEGLGIRSTARILRISTTTLTKKIIAIAKGIKAPAIQKNKSYQVDEMRTFIKKKNNLYWIAYALQQETKKVVSYTIGKRTNKTLKRVITSLELSEAKKIITDKLINYKFLIQKEIHSTKHRGINHIERHNLSIRTHIKRLNRKTICFSRSLIVLNAILKIYLWG